MPTPANASDAYKNQLRTIIDPNVVHVGTGSTHETIQSAIDAISDSSVTKPYTVLVAPGTYAPFDFSAKTYISVIGYGNSSLINCVAGSTVTSRVLVSGHHNQISKLGFKYTDTGGDSEADQYCISPNGQYSNFILDDCYFDIEHTDVSRTSNTIFAFGSTVARGLVTGVLGFGDIIRNNVVYSDSSAFSTCSGGTIDFYNNQIILTTRDSGSYISGYNHYGVRHVGNGRVFWHTGHLTSGYGANNVHDDTGNIYGFYEAGDQSNARINIHSCNGILRNDSLSATGDVHYIHIPNTVGVNFECRIFNGFRGQCEAPSGSVETRSIVTSRVPWDDTNNPGRIMYQGGGFTNESNGNIAGFRYDITDAADTWEPAGRDIQLGGDWYCDTNSAAFTINLRALPAKPMIPLRIYNTDFGGSNDLTIGQGTGTPAFDIDGGSANQTSVTIAPGTSKTFTLQTDGGYWVS